MSNRYVNRIIKDDDTYYVEYIWRDGTNDKKRDSFGKNYIVPHEGNIFGDKQRIIKLLTLAHRILNDLKGYEKFPIAKDCPLCGKKNVDKKKYISANRIWSNGILHYIQVHNIEPSVGFKEFIYNDMMSTLERKLTRSINTGIFCDSNLIKRSSKRSSKRSLPIKKKITKCQKLRRATEDMVLNKVKINNEEYIKLEKNKLLILDALMVSGRFKKYIDPYNSHIKRYSEHAGFLDFDNGNLQKIVVSGQTDRVDIGDDEIFLPQDMEEMLEYEYIFHTHPPTPKPGGRAIHGILYEFPSAGDIFHFIDHYNDGNVIGSLIIAPEGLYNIRRYIDEEKGIKMTNANKSRKYIESYDYIDIDESELYEQYRKIFRAIQKDAIIKYGTEFSINEFYEQIAHDMSYLNRFNRILNQYQIHIDYYPRKKDGKHWFIDTVFLKFKNYYDNK
jgi:hypothetical protein